MSKNETIVMVKNVKNHFGVSPVPCGTATPMFRPNSGIIKFPKHIYYSIICIAALIARQQDDHRVVAALGVPHVGERSERDLIAAFVDKIATVNRQLVTFNGSRSICPSYDTAQWSTKCLRLVCRRAPTFIGTLRMQSTCATFYPLFAWGKSHAARECRVMSLPGKPEGINCAEVEQYYRDSRIREIADYCEIDVVNTHRVWLRHELFQGN